MPVKVKRTDLVRDLQQKSGTAYRHSVCSDTAARPWLRTRLHLTFRILPMKRDVDLLRISV